MEDSLENDERFVKHEFEIDPYRHLCVVVVTNDIDVYINTLMDYVPGYLSPGDSVDEDDNFALTARGTKIEDTTVTKCSLCIINPDNEAAPITPGIIASEALRIMGHMYSYYGCKWDYDNSEFMAYQLQWLVDKITEIIQEYTGTHARDKEIYN